MEYPFFSVVIPTYNHEVFLKKAVQSVLNQKLLNFMIKRGWQKAINELSVYFLKTIENG